MSRFRVEASATELPVSLLHRAVVDDIVARRDLAATIATDLAGWRDFDWIHFSVSIADTKTFASGGQSHAAWCGEKSKSFRPGAKPLR